MLRSNNDHGQALDQLGLLTLKNLSCLERKRALPLTKLTPVLRTTLTTIHRFAGHGGPDISHLRGVSLLELLFYDQANKLV